MPIVLNQLNERLTAAVTHYWRTLDSQASRQTTDRGHRSAVTGGKQMDGFSSLVHSVLEENGVHNASIFVQNKRELPGYFRASKDWDLLVVHSGHLVAAVEFKSQRGPSFGNNFNNRAEEALGNAVDLWTAYREAAFGAGALRPFLGWVMLLEDSPGSQAPVRVKLPHFLPFPEFERASYAKRYELLLRRLMAERLYDGTALLLSPNPGAEQVSFTEPAADLTMRGLLAGLAGHAAAFLASGRDGSPT